MLRVVFMGTPEFGVPSLQALCEMTDLVQVVGVFTQPDRPSGRGHKLEAPPVKKECILRNLPCFQFERVRKQEGLDQMRLLKPDLVVTAAFGQILSKKLLEVPRLGTVNVHASLLPKHRGAAPINWSILMGEKITGVTTMFTDVGLDTGDMLLKTEVTIGENETAGELTQRLSQEGALLLQKTVRALAEGTLQRIPQNEAEMSYEPMLEKELGRVNWEKTAQEIHNLVRGVNPWPGAYTNLGDLVLKIWGSRATNETTDALAGTVLRAGAKEGLFVAAGGGTVLEITDLQAPGGKRMSAGVYLSGKHIENGVRLGEEHEAE